MRIKYELPQFNAYVPKKLIRLAQKLDIEEEYKAFNFSEKRKDKIMEKLNEGNMLRKSEMKILLYSLDEVEKMQLLESFLVKMKKFFNHKQKMYYHLKAGLFSYYKLYQSEPIYDAIRIGFFNNLEWKKEAFLIKKIIYDCLNVRDFIQRLYAEIATCDTKEKFEEKIKLLMLKKDTPLLNIIVASKVLNAIGDNLPKNTEYLLELVKEYVPKNNYKEIFEKVLLSSNMNIKIENTSSEIDLWFNFIGEEFGDPYGRYKTKWIELSEEAKKIFQKWKALKNIKYFFSEITGDPRRLKFWKKYADYFFRVEYIEKCSKALLMETSKHLFIEFAAGGALFMYRKEILNIQSVEEILSSHSKTYVTNAVLKARNKSEEYLVHRSRWEYEFERKFEYYEYYT
ncbi:EH signature domain-containing protein [Clostridium sp.]